jgi:hypothetical protein
LPSTRQPMIWARFLGVSLFILTIMLERSDGRSEHPRGEVRSGQSEGKRLG